MSQQPSIVLVDDHALLRNGLASIVSDLGYPVLYECSNGRQLMEQIGRYPVPDVVLMDINMPEMDGFETTSWLQEHHPLSKVLALSMYDDEQAIIRMIRCGAKGYILKDTSPQELKQAIEAVWHNGFHYSDLVTGRLINSIQGKGDNGQDLLSKLNSNQVEFLKLCCTEMTYKEMADHMHKSPRTIDGYRDDLFVLLNVKSRVGLALFALKHKICTLN